MLGTGRTHSVRDFVDAAFSHAGLDYEAYVRRDPRFDRPQEAESLVADASKARRVLGWSPQVAFDELVAMMVDADLAATRAGW